MKKQRLLKLADLLEQDAKNQKGVKFDFLEWGFVMNTDEPLSCQTSACALGLAAVSGAFKRSAALGFKCRYGSGLIDFTVEGRHVKPVTAAMRTFGISKGDAKYLFTSSSGLDALSGAVAEKQVARRIRQFVADAY